MSSPPAHRLLNHWRDFFWNDQWRYSSRLLTTSGAFKCDSNELLVGAEAVDHTMVLWVVMVHRSVMTSTPPTDSFVNSEGIYWKNKQTAMVQLFVHTVYVGTGKSVWWRRRLYCEFFWFLSPGTWWRFLQMLLNKEVSRHLIIASLTYTTC